MSEGPRETLVGFFRGVSETMTVLLSGIIRLAPVAVFALSLALAARVGLSATAELGAYVLVLSGLCVALILGLLLVPWVLARVSPVRFARAAAPAQLVAFAAHSSLASLPAMLDGAERVLGVPKPVSRFTLPLAVSTLKVSGPVHCLTAAYFVARLTGTAIPPAELVSLAVLSLVLSFSLPGVPHGAILVTAPVLAAAGLPTAAVALLLAVDSIPNAFRSAANSTGNMVSWPQSSELAAGRRASPRTGRPAAELRTPTSGSRARSCLRRRFPGPPSECPRPRPRGRRRRCPARDSASRRRSPSGRRRPRI